MPEPVTAGSAPSVERARSSRTTWIDVWFAVGLTLTSATQLRLPGMPVGAGELLLAAWASAALGALLLGKGTSRDPLLGVLGRFWAVGGVALVAGTLWGSMLLRTATTSEIAHDAGAFAFVMLVTLPFVALPNLRERVRGTFRAFTVCTTAPLLTVMLSGVRSVPLGPFSFGPWYGGVRFTGWAENPNQIALAVLLVPWLGLAVAAEDAPGWRRNVVRVCALGAAPIALASASDALAVSWLAGAGLYSLLLWRRLARRGRRSFVALSVAYLLVPLAIAAAAVAAGPALLRLTERAGSATYNEGGQGSLRIILWRHGLQAWSVSPFFGLGPGAHSGESGPFLGFEAHNTFIDWGSCAGLVGILAYLAIFAWAFRGLLARGRMALLCGLVMLLAFSAFHYVLRQPVFWFYFIALVVLSSGTGAFQTPSAGSAPAPGEAPRPEATPAFAHPDRIGA